MTPSTRTILEQAAISADLTQHILDASDGGRFNPPSIKVENLPPVNGDNIIDFTSRSEQVLELTYGQILQVLAAQGLSAESVDELLTRSGCCPATPSADSLIRLSHAKLKALGLYFLPLVSFGLLNGGSASSYFDHKKNREFSPFFHQQYEALISRYANLWGNRPKGVSPAFMVEGTVQQPDYSFIELKLRAWLLQIRQYQYLSAQLRHPLPWDGLERTMPVFQMVNRALAGDVEKAINSYRDSPLLADLIRETGVDISHFETGVQDLVAAFTQAGPDGSREVFLSANGQANTPLALPGGHGQNFKVLEPIYRQLAASGKRLAYLGNIDNLGYIPDPAAVALMILTDRPAGFEFSYKTRLDRKGGVLITTDQGHLTCGDIGQAVSPQLVADTESKGQAILFNCATGLFSLNYLIPHLAAIQQQLPIRFSNQDKDAGRYSQAEQTTWEVIGLIYHPLILAVDKQERFLASKFFLDCLLTSGFGQQLQVNDEADRQLQITATGLNQGLRQLLSETYGLHLSHGTWQPI